MKLLWIGLLLVVSCLAVEAAVPQLTDFNTNQFVTAGGIVTIKNGALVTNLVGAGGGSITSTFPITVTGGTNVGIDATSDLAKQTNNWRNTSKASVRDLFSVPTRLVFDGDSLTSSNTAWVPYFTNLVSYPPNLVSNVAVSGQVIPALQSRYTNYVQPCKPAGGTNALLFVWAGINDIFYNTNTPTVIIANLSNYWTQARADGFDVVAFTITDRNNFPSQTNALERSYINSWIRRQGGVLWDYLVDVDSFMPAAYLGSESYYIAEGTNFVHFTAEGARMIAGAAFKTIFSPKNATALTPAEIMAPRYSGMTYFPDGTAALPSIGFSSQHNTGLYRSGGDIGVTMLGTVYYGLLSTDLRVGQGLPIGFSSGSPFAVGPDVFLMRDSAATLQMGKDALTPINQTFKGPDATGTDHDGGTVTIEGGAGSGAARGGDIITKTSVSTNSSLVTQLYSTRHYESSRPSPMTNSAANPVLNILVNTNHYIACKIFACTFAGDVGGDFQAFAEELTISAVNKAGAISAVVSASRGTNLAASSASTLTTTWTAVASGNTLDIKNTPVSSLTPTTYYTKWTADVLSNDPATIAPY